MHSRLIVKNKPFACKRVQVRPACDVLARCGTRRPFRKAPEASLLRQDQFMARFEAHGISACRIDLMQVHVPAHTPTHMP